MVTFFLLGRLNFISRMLLTHQQISAIYFFAMDQTHRTHFYKRFYERFSASKGIISSYLDHSICHILLIVSASGPAALINMSSTIREANAGLIQPPP